MGSRRTLHRRALTALIPVAIAGAALAAQAMPAPATPDVGITITGPDNLAAGEPGVWNVSVTNTGTVDVMAEDIMVDMPLFGWYDMEPMRLPAGGVLEPGASIPYRGTARFGTEICGKKKDLTVVAEVSLKTGADADVENDRAETTAWAEGCLPDLEVTKTADGTSFAPGDEVRWTVTVTNRGNTWIPVEWITVSDPMVPSLTLVDPPAGGWLAPGAALHYRAATTTEACGTLTNTAEVAIDDAYRVEDIRPDNNVASHSVAVDQGSCAPPPETTPPVTTPPVTPPATPVPPPAAKPEVCLRTALTTRIVTPKRRWAGSIQNVRILVRNRGANTARGVVLRYRVPRGASLMRRPARSTLRGRVLTMRVPTMAARRQRGMTLQIRWARQQGGNRLHVSRASATCAAADTHSVRTHVRPLQGAVLPAVTG